MKKQDKCDDRKEMVHAASSWMNEVRDGERRTLTLYFDDGTTARGRFSALEDGYFSFRNEANPGNGAGNSSDTAWRQEDHPYCTVKKIVRDYYREYRGGGE